MARRRCYLLHLIVLLNMKFICKSEANGEKMTVQAKSIEDFKRLCPFTDLCFSKASETFINSSNVLGDPCCQSCTCEDHCGNNCCPDKPEQFMNEFEVKMFHTPMEQCVFAQLRPFNLSAVNGDLYKMISKCPENHQDQNVMVKCSREYHEFDFENDDLTTLMPVSSSISNSTYKNIHCALCNGVSKSDLQFWDTKVQCDNGRKLSIYHISTIMFKLSQEPLCQVIFEPTATTPSRAVATCGKTINRCNVTGNWRAYDFTIESACLSYFSKFSLYKNIHNPKYNEFKNIHCFLCNGYNINEVYDLCLLEGSSGRGPSFVALLDFNDLEFSVVEKKSKTHCSFGSKYDSYKKKCRPLSCPTGLRLSMNNCQPVYKEIEFSLLDMVFGVRFKLYPTQMFKESGRHNLLAFGLSLHGEITSKIQSMVTTMNPHICALNAYVKLNQSLENTILSMYRGASTNIFSFISYIAIIVDFNFNGLKNITTTLEEANMLFTSNDYYAHYNIEYSADDTGMPSDSSDYIIGEESYTKLNQLGLDPFRHDMLIKGRNDLENRSGILTFPLEPLSPKPKCVPDLLIQPKPLCPRIKLNKNEFEIDSAKKKVRFLENEESSRKVAPDILFSKILSSSRDESVYVCSDEYFSQLPSEVSKFSDGYDELDILTLVCLSFSIISLIITFIVYCILPRLRNVPGLNNMALVFHLFFAHTLALAIAATDIRLSWLCSTVGILLHFNLVSSFFWMFISTFHMMKVFVNLKEKSASSGHTLSKFGYYVIFAESVSASMVISLVVVTLTSGQSSEGFGYGGPNCYVREDIMILYFVVIPLGVVITLNFGMFTYVIWSVSRIPDMAHKSNHERHNLLIFAKLSTLTGITWAFGLLYQFTNVLMFAYFYIVLNAGQGVFIMISFINKRTLNMLRSYVYKNTNGGTNNSTKSTKLKTNTKKERNSSNNALNDTNIKL